MIPLIALHTHLLLRAMSVVADVKSVGVETTFTRHSAGHVRRHHQSHGEADVDGERFAQAVSAEDGLSD